MSSSPPAAGPRQLQAAPASSSARFASPKQLTKRTSHRAPSTSTSTSTSTLNPSASPLFNAAAYHKISSSRHGSSSSQSSRHTSAKPSMDSNQSQQQQSKPSNSTSINVTQTHPAFEQAQGSSWSGTDPTFHDSATHHPAAALPTSNAHDISTISSHASSLRFDYRSVSAGNPRQHQSNRSQANVPSTSSSSSTLHQASSFIKSLLPQMSTNAEVVQSAVSSISHPSTSMQSKASHYQHSPSTLRLLSDVTVVLASAAALWSISKKVDKLRTITK